MPASRPDVRTNEGDDGIYKRLARTRKRESRPSFFPLLVLFFFSFSIYTTLVSPILYYQIQRTLGWRLYTDFERRREKGRRKEWRNITVLLRSYSLALSLSVVCVKRFFLASRLLSVCLEKRNEEDSTLPPPSFLYVRMELGDAKRSPTFFNWPRKGRDLISSVKIYN